MGKVEIARVYNIFTAAQSMTGYQIAMGIIWAVVMGLAMGNYVCSLIHRLPRGLSLLDKTPYCGSCGAPLQVRDLFPVVSAVLLGHRCRYCRAPFPAMHTVAELLVMAVFVLSFLRFNFIDIGILFSFIGTFLVALVTINLNSGRIMWQVMVVLVVLGLLLRSLIDHSLFFSVQGGLLAAIVAAIIFKKRIQKIGHIYRLPVEGELLAVAGIAVGIAGLPLFFTLLAGLCAVIWSAARMLGKQFYFTIPFAFSLFLVLLCK